MTTTKKTPTPPAEQTDPATNPATTEAGAVEAPRPMFVHEAWAAVMAEVRAVGKNDEVKTGPARFSFRGIDAVLMAVGPVLRKHGVYVVPVGVDVLATEHNPTKSGGLMKNVTICVTWRVTGPAGDSFVGISLGEGSDAGDKAISKAHSVAFRTFLIQSLALPTDEPDPDHTNYERAQANQQANPQANPQGYYDGPGPGIKDWGPVMAEVEGKKTEAELRVIWDREDMGFAPQWVNERFTRHLQAVRGIEAQQAAGTGPQ